MARVAAPEFKVRASFLSASRRFRYFTATMVSVSAFVAGVQNSREITHDKNLVGCKEAAERFVRMMQGLDDKVGPLLL